MHAHALYKEIFIWSRLNETSAVRYTCFESLQDGRFAVQSADFFYLPLTPHTLQAADMQKVELLIETPIAERCRWYSTLQEAIAAHQAEFV